MSDENGSVWVYGIIPAGAKLEELERRGDHLPEVWVVETGDLGAIVGDAPEENEKATRNQALSHAQVLEAAIVDAPVVPFRFGVMVPSDQDVGTDLLDERQDEFGQLLERVKDHVEMQLKVYYHEQAILREVVEGQPQIQQLREQMKQGPEEATRDVRAQLGELVSKIIEQKREADSQDILEQLKPVAAAAVVEGLEKEFMVLNAPLLIERDRQEEFEQTVEDVAEERADRMQFRLLGPMPAYHFIETQEPAWA